MYNHSNSRSMIYSVDSLSSKCFLNLDSFML